MVYLYFIICATVIFFAGKKVSCYLDAIAEITAVGKAWIGLILIASVTSLPELMVGISSAAIVKSADLAVGDILGSCAFNLGILAIMDAFAPKHKTVLGTVSNSHVLAASLGIILISLVGVALFLPQQFVISPGIGVTSILFAVIYLIAIRLIFSFNKNQHAAINSSVNNYTITLKNAALNYSFYAFLIVVAAAFLPSFADEIAEQTGLGKSFVGTLLLAGSTSLPEMAVSIAAVRMGSIDLMVGNLFGSNIFNIFILFIDDLFYTGGHILKDASTNNLISVFCVIAMSAVAIIGIIYKNKHKQYLLAWDATFIFIIYLKTCFYFITYNYA